MHGNKPHMPQLASLQLFVGIVEPLALSSLGFLFNLQCKLAADARTLKTETKKDRKKERKERESEWE